MEYFSAFDSYSVHISIYALQRRSEGVPGVSVTPRLCKPFLSKQPTIFRGENTMTIMFVTVLPPPPPPLKNPGYAPALTLLFPL